MMKVTKRKKSHASAPGTLTIIAHTVNSAREEKALRLSKSNSDDGSKI